METKNLVKNLLYKNNPKLESLWMNAFVYNPKIYTFTAPSQANGEALLTQEGDAHMLLLYAEVNSFDSVEAAVVELIGKNIQAFGDALPPDTMTLNEAKVSLYAWWDECSLKKISYYPNMGSAVKRDIKDCLEQTNHTEQIEPALELLGKQLMTCEFIFFSEYEKDYPVYEFIAYNEQYIFSFSWWRTW